MFTRKDTKALKGIAIILMVYHHLFAFPDRLGEGIEFVSLFSLKQYTSAYYIGVFGKICVTLFIFLAGYGTWVSYSRKKSFKLIAKKIIELYKVYWAVLFIFFPICMLCGIEEFSNTSILIFLKNFLGLSCNYNGEWWFFKPYVILILTFPIIYKIVNMQKRYIWTDVISIFIINSVCVYIVLYASLSVLKVNLICIFLVETLKLVLTILPGFLLGCLCAKYNVFDIVLHFSDKYKFVGYCIAVCMSVSVFIIRTFYDSNNDYIYAFILIVSALILLRGRIGKYIYKPLCLLGEESTIIWLCHTFYCYKLCQKIIFYPRYSILIVLWLLIITFLTSKVIKLGIKKVGIVFTKVFGKNFIIDIRENVEI